MLFTSFWPKVHLSIPLISPRCYIHLWHVFISTEGCSLLTPAQVSIYRNPNIAPSSVSDVLFGFSPVCVFKCPFKSPALEEEKSCWLQRVDFSPVWVLNESSNSWSEMMYSYIGCTLHNWMRPTTSTKLYSSVSSITISLQFGVVNGLALLHMGHHDILHLQTQPLSLLNSLPLRRSLYFKVQEKGLKTNLGCFTSSKELASKNSDPSICRDSFQKIKIVLATWGKGPTEWDN